MSSLLASLPAPKNAQNKTRQMTEEVAAPKQLNQSVTGRNAGPPPYGQRSGWVPRRPEDFENGRYTNITSYFSFTSRRVYNPPIPVSPSSALVPLSPNSPSLPFLLYYSAGGAFPEIHVAQFPLNMGRPDKQGQTGRSSQTLALTVNADGDVNYDAIVRQGKNRNTLVASTYSALVPKLEKLNSDMPKPDDEEAQKTAKETADALGKALLKKRSAIDPQALPGQPGAAQYIKYQPSNPQGTTRIIKMQEAQVDPLEPPKFRHTKVASTSGDAPVPIMHSPPRKSTAQDQQDWIIPPCVSNWKNAKGYTIPLDKRLAADGRGLQEVQINNSFAKFSEALYIAEQKARSAVDARGKMQRELLAREKEHKEAELRDLAMKARLDRLGVGGMGERVEEAGGGGGGPSASGAAPMRHHHGKERGVHSDEDDMPRRREKSRSRATDGSESSEEEEDEGKREDETREERRARLSREEIREDRRRERERERRLESKDAHGYKRSKVTRDRDRDISERVALGMAKVAGGGEAMYDQRLFNQDVGGTGAGGVGGNDEAYNIYDKPLFTDRSELFKATAGEGRSKRDVDEADLPGGGGGDVDTKRFKPDKGFAGAEYGSGGGGGGEGGAVVFEQDPAGEAADPFGLGTFLSDVKGGKKKGGALDGIGKRGGMAAAGGGGGGDGTGRRREFVSASDK